MKILLTTLLSFLLHSSFAQSEKHDEEVKIKHLLSVQTDAWNRGDIRAFMQTYWHSDSLLFIGKHGVKKGWDSAYENYKKSYPDTAAMGKLSFDIVEIKHLSPLYFYLVGKWKLIRSVGNLDGHFDLLLKKIGGKWLIICDHSS